MDAESTIDSLRAALAAAEARVAELEAELASVHALEGAFDALSRQNVTIAQDLAGATRELAHERALSEMLIRAVPAGMAYVDPDLIIRWINPSGPALEGFDPSSMIGLPLAALYPDMAPDHAILRARETRVAMTDRARPFGRRPDGAEVYWDVTCVPLMEPSGELNGLLIMAIDVTASVENERYTRERIESLLELDRLKQNFINAASHELRTPLTSIAGYAEFLEDELAGPLTPAQRNYVTQIQEGRFRLQCIVDDLLDYARLEAGTFSLVCEETDLIALAHTELASLWPQAREAGVTIAARVPDAGVRVHADSRRLGQVLLNLVGNAIKFSPRGSRIEVAISAEAQAGRIEVRDQGIGVAPADQAKIFEKFFQVDAGLNRARGGAGLGLSIAKALVSAHGGEIGIESELGQGACFWFTVPLSAEAGLEGERRAQPARS